MLFLSWDLCLLPICIFLCIFYQVCSVALPHKAQCTWITCGGPRTTSCCSIRDLSSIFFACVVGLVHKDSAHFPLLAQSTTKSHGVVFSPRRFWGHCRFLKDLLLTTSPFFYAKRFLHFLPNLNLFSQRKSLASLNSVCAYKRGVKHIKQMREAKPV